jgi:dCMP deaminase
VNTKWDERFLRLAAEVASWSKDPSTKTGAVIANGKQVISAGFNGFPQGMPDDDELYANREEKYSRVVHCEINALIFAGAHPKLAGSTLYTVPFLSCDRCVVQMLQAGVSRFVAPEPTADQLTRWGAAFARTKQYITECGGTWLEIGL